MMPYFDSEDAAVRYARYRPKVHGVVLDWIARAGFENRFMQGLDVGCGTGDSTVPLLSICDDVVAIDASATMVAVARDTGLDAYVYRFEDLNWPNQFDLISCAMALHWLTPEHLIEKLLELSEPGALWVIYNFAFRGHSSDTAFNTWFERYKRRFPAPDRHTSTMNWDADERLDRVGSDTGVLPVHFSVQELCGYLCTQSNVEAAVKAGRSYREIEQELNREVVEFELNGPFEYAYRADLWCVSTS